MLIAEISFLSDSITKNSGAGAALEQYAQVAQLPS